MAENPTTDSKAANAPADAPANAPTPIYFDKDGELRLLVGPGEAAFVVCPRSLGRASAVWKAMLYGSWAESKPESGEWHVKLPEDNPEYLAILLAIVHHKFDKVPIAPKSDFVLHLCAISDKYDVVYLLRPWAITWCHVMMKEPANGNALLAAWHLGAHKLFCRNFRDLVVNSAIDVDGHFLCWKGYETTTSKHLSAVGVVEQLESCRLKLIGRMLGILSAKVQTLQSLSTSKICTVQWSDAERTDCESLLFASLVRALMAAGLFPIPQAKQILCSASTISTAIGGQSFKSLQSGNGTRHTVCVKNLGVTDLLQETAKDMEDELTGRKQFGAHLDAQVKKSGACMS